MIIDIHTHTFPAKIAAATIEKLSHISHTVPFSDGTCEGLLSHAKEAGINLSVILPVATAAKQVEHINDASARINENCNGEGLFSFGCMHPAYENYREELSRIKELGLKGIKIHPVYQEADIDGLEFLRILDRAAELDLIVLTHAGYDIGYPDMDRCSPLKCRNVINRIGNFRFICAHMGGWKQWDEVPYYLADTSVYLDTAFSTGYFHPLTDGHWENEQTQMMDEDQFLTILSAFGPDRLLFGTDSPWSSQTESLEFLHRLPIEEKDLDKILGENARRLLEIDESYKSVD
ncbi:MAG: amidohydrolase family protein [Blautia sp.]|nr:amidohydrolase family protein [Blautia sp.]